MTSTDKDGVKVRISKGYQGNIESHNGFGVDYYDDLFPEFGDAAKDLNNIILDAKADAELASESKIIAEQIKAYEYASFQDAIGNAKGSTDIKIFSKLFYDSILGDVLENNFKFAQWHINDNLQFAEWNKIINEVINK